jgi:hypothetical protein
VKEQVVALHIVHGVKESDKRSLQRAAPTWRDRPEDADYLLNHVGASSPPT